MQVKPVSGKLRDSIEAMFNIRDPDPDKLLQDAAKALSEITGCAAFTSTHTPDTVTVRQVEIIPSGEHAVVIMVMTSNGVIRSRVCRTNFRVTGEVVEFLKAYCAGKLAGRTLREISLQYMGSVTMELGEYSRIFTPLFAAIFNLCAEIYGGQYYMEGGIKLLSYPELARDADRLAPLHLGEPECAEADPAGQPRTDYDLYRQGKSVRRAAEQLGSDYPLCHWKPEHRFHRHHRPDPDGLRRHGSRNGILCPAGGRTSHRDI